MFAKLVAPGTAGQISPMGACANGYKPNMVPCYNGDLPIGGKCGAGSVIGPPP